MELVFKKNILFTLLFILFTFFNCKPEKKSCYYVMRLNIPTEFTMRAPIFYAIEDHQVVEQIKGKQIVDDYYESKINSIKVIKDYDTLDSNDGGFIRLKIISGVTCIRFHTARFQMLQKDSISAMEQIKREDILLELKNGHKIRLNYCQD